MNLFDWFRSRNTAPIARERLKMVLAHERVGNTHSQLVAVLQEEILAVIAKHMQIDRDKVMVKLDKGDFLGRDAVVARKDASTQRLTCLTLPEPGAVVMGREPVYAGDRCVGYVTSAAYGHTIGAGIAYAWLPERLTAVGTRVQIGYFDQRVDAVVTAEPLFDPGMTRLRG